ncbi:MULTISPECIES: RDD family protein [unclassified Nocardioides]|uniref:RDD family protein n=1 Tax=unclassified Nocardioides TaxID=2615069 RepID=UPI003014D14F
MTDHPTPDAADAAFPAAELDRRFYAFTLDRLLGWTVIAAGVAGAVMLLLEPGHTIGGIAVIVGVVLVVGLVHAVLLGLRGTSPGKAAVGLRVVDVETGAPIGVGRALLRTVVLGVGTLPTFGFGVAALAWTAVMDPGGRRRGWHDRRARSVVVDVRPLPAAEIAEEPAPRAIVNLTAMRLVPPPPEPERPEPPARPAPRPPVAAPPTPAPPTLPTPARPAPPVPTLPTPAPSPVAPSAPPVPEPAPEPAREIAPEPVPEPVEVSALEARTAPTRTRRRQLGYPLVGTPPTGPPPAVPPAAPPSSAPAAPPTPSAPAPQPRWRVAFDTGEAFEVSGLTLVGRRPEGRPGEPVHRLVPLASEDQSLSKTHAQFQVVPDGALVVMDRGSTNGSVLIRRGVPRHLSGNKPATLLAGDQVRFGDRTMTVARDD